MKFFHFLFEILIFLLEELDARFSNVYNNHDKAYHWKNCIFYLKYFDFCFNIYKAFSNIYNNRDKAYHGVSPFFI